MWRLGGISLVFFIAGGCAEKPEPEKQNFELIAAPGTNKSEAAETFKTLVGHCPGIKKYKPDIEQIRYEGNSHFEIKIAEKLTVIPAESYGRGHICTFSVDAEKASTGKSSCAWLCTGEDMTGINGDNRSYSNGKLIGPLVKPWENLSRAIAGTVSEMAEIRGNDISKGAAKLIIWGTDNLKWSELQEIPVAKYAMVMKDPESQRGKRICTSGQLVEIEVDNAIPGKKIYHGGIFDESGHLYRFVAIGSTGELVARSRARFCGIVTGQQHYQNSAGGVAHAVHLVGMFDLPENK